MRSERKRGTSILGIEERTMAFTLCKMQKSEMGLKQRSAVITPMFYKYHVAARLRIDQGKGSMVKGKKTT